MQTKLRLLVALSRDYYERRPFKFDGKIGKVVVALK